MPLISALLNDRVDEVQVENWVKNELRKAIVEFRFCQLGQLVVIYLQNEL